MDTGVETAMKSKERKWRRAQKKAASPYDKGGMVNTRDDGLI